MSSEVTGSVCWSLYAFLRSPDDYWETICTAIGAGGDTDTTAAMAGGIVGARLGLKGLPQELLARLNDQGDMEGRRAYRSGPALLRGVPVNRGGDVTALVAAASITA